MPDDAYAVNPSADDVSVDDGTIQVVPAFSLKKVDVTTFSDWTDAGCALIPLTSNYAQRRRLADALRYGPTLDDESITQATLTTALTGTNNDLVFTAVNDENGLGDGYAGNSISVAYTVPTDDNAAHALALSVTRTENAGQADSYLITCQLEVDVDGSTILTTSDELKTALAADAAVSALVSAADSGADDGTGVLTVMAASALSGGSGRAYARQVAD
jgi:hypothetical protein